jgi:hypothetical protein
MGADAPAWPVASGAAAAVARVGDLVALTGPEAR